MDRLHTVRMIKVLYRSKSQFETKGKKILASLSKKYGGRLRRAQFRTFCLSSNSMLFPAFALHRTLRKNILGKKAWKRISKQRNRRPITENVAPPASPSRRRVAQPPPKHILVKAEDNGMRSSSGEEEEEDDEDGYSLPRPPGLPPSFDLETPPRPAVRRTSKLTQALTQKEAKSPLLCAECKESKAQGAKDEHGVWYCTQCWKTYQESSQLEKNGSLEDAPVVGIAVAPIVGKATPTNTRRCCAQCQKICSRSDGAEDENGSWYCKRCWVNYAEGTTFM